MLKVQQNREVFRRRHVPLLVPPHLPHLSFAPLHPSQSFGRNSFISLSFTSSLLLWRGFQDSDALVLVRSLTEVKKQRILPT